MNLTHASMVEPVKMIVLVTSVHVHKAGLVQTVRVGMTIVHQISARMTGNVTA